MVVDQTGVELPLKYEVDVNEGGFLQEMVARVKPKSSIEIGCAHGISSTFICEELARSCPGVRHVIVDPFQTTDWRGIGITTLRTAGFDNFELVEKRSEFVLAELAQAGRKFDFAFIDGWHTFDHTLLDFFYLNRMLNVNGVIVFDDVSMPPVHKCVRYVTGYPAYRVIGGVNPNQLSWKWRLIRRVQRGVGSLSGLVGRRIAGEFFSQEVLADSECLGLNASMVALQKVAEDTRNWEWFKPF